jgi:putative protease
LPAGNAQALDAILDLPIQAVYASLPHFHLRSAYPPSQVAFSADELLLARERTRLANVRLYVAVNALVSTMDNGAYRRTIDEAAACGPDALILGDLWGIAYATSHYPQLPVHLSSVQNTRTLEDIRGFAAMGVKRIILPSYLTMNIREGALRSLRDLHAHSPLPLECVLPHTVTQDQMRFMCKSCCLSAFMSGTNAYEGRCSTLKDGRYIRPCEELTHSFCPKQKPGARIGRNFLSAILSTGIDCLKVEGRQLEPRLLRELSLRLLDLVRATTV